jgi:hypothetical protein
MLAALFIFASLAICGYFLWKLADEWVAEYARPAGSYSIADRTCFRCRVHDVGFRCRRCRATIVPVEHIVVGAAARLGFAAGVNLGALLSLELDLEDMRCVTILVPRGVAVRSGDRVRFVFDHRHRLDTWKTSLSALVGDYRFVLPANARRSRGSVFLQL